LSVAQRIGATAVVFTTRLAARKLKETRLPAAVEPWRMAEKKFPKIRPGDDPA